MATCFDSCNSPCFKIIYEAISKFDLKIKEALYINQKKKLTSMHNKII